MRSSQKVSGRNPRAIRACARCRRRKIKCDFVYPQCGACIAVGVECLGYDTTTGGEQPRSLVKFLENRIAYLEIELSLLQANVAGEQDLDQKTIPHAFPGIRSHLLRSLILRNDLDPTRGVASWLSAPYLSSSLLPTLASDGGATNVVDSSQMKDNDLAQKRDIASIPRNVVDIMLRHYSEVYLAQYPIVDEAELMEQCNRVYDRKATPFDLFVVCMALSISVSLT